MQKNTLNFNEFMIYSLLLNIIVYLVYRNIFFKTVGGLSIIGSHGVLGMIILISFIVNFFATYSWGKNEKAVLATTLLSYGIYTYIAYLKYIKTAYMWISVVTVSVTVAYLVLVFGRKISNAKYRKKIIRNRRRKGFEGVRNIVACAGIMFTITAFVQYSVMGGVTSRQIHGTAVYGDEYAYEENIDMLLYLQSEEWDKLGDNLDMKLSVLATVINAEGRTLGFTKKITLYTKDLNEGILGFYSPDNDAIFLDTDHIINDSSREVLGSCLHECFHVAQRQYVDLYNSLEDKYKNMYFLMDAKVFAKEFDSYVDGKDNYLHYYSQMCESSARAYEEATSQLIFDRINEYLREYGSN